MIQMYDGVVNSIETVTTGAINATDTIVNVLNETQIPDAPNLLVLGIGASAETVKLVSKIGTALTVERGLQGTAKSWASGTLVARNFTEYDHRAFKENIEDVNTQMAQHELELDNKCDKVVPTETIITTGFASGWSGTIRVRKTQEGLVTLHIACYKSETIAPAGETIYTLPTVLRPKDTSTFVFNASANNYAYSKALVNLVVYNTGELFIIPASSQDLTGAGTIPRIVVSYYAVS